ncbi:glycosyltransferase [bacterium]|nr:glycosyltransferase [bacterium]
MKFTVYIGYDTTNLGQHMARTVCERSIRKYNADIEIKTLELKDLINSGVYTRPHDDRQSTEFTYTRFLVPYLNDYNGFAIFCDSDFLWQRNIYSLIAYVDSEFSISCVHHEYTHCPKERKMDGFKQEWYPRKNWSSLMVFNCAHDHCKRLTPEVVSTESPKYLHRMEWTDDVCINQIPHSYNYLTGYYNTHKRPAAYHFTDGGPWHKDTADCEFGDKWLAYLTDEERTQWEQGEFWER